MSAKQNPQTPKPDNRRLTQFRRLHRWGGVAAALLLVVLGTTGSVLNYKQPIFARLGIETKRERDVSPLPASELPVSVRFTTGAGVAGDTVDFAGALAIARAEWGDVPLERAELRAERGAVSYRFRKSGGAELWVDATDGRHLVKGAYERVGKPDKDGNVTRTTDWGKILIDLHTGKIGGEVGKAIMTSAAVLLLLLSLSGVYLWLKPLLIRRENRRWISTAQPGSHESRRQNAAKLSQPQQL